MKRILYLMIAMITAFSMTACSGDDSNEPIELNIFAAASLTEALNEIATMYREVAPDVTLTYTFDSSGTLKTQIENGAVSDVFISAAQKQMNALDIASDANADNLDFIDSNSRINLVENKVVLAVKSDSNTDITSFEDLVTDKVKTLALGNSDVPVGQYSEEIFTNMGIWEDLNNSQKITFGSNAKEVTTWVEEGVADCGVIYKTDAFSAGLKPVAEAPKGTLKTPVLYPAAVLKNSENPEAAEAFLAFLQTDECSTVFESVGFSIPK